MAPPHTRWALPAAVHFFDSWLTRLAPASPIFISSFDLVQRQVPIEDNVKALCPFISNCMMVGDRMPFNCMLITLKAVGANQVRRHVRNFILIDPF